MFYIPDFGNVTIGVLFTQRSVLITDIEEGALSVLVAVVKVFGPDSTVHTTKDSFDFVVELSLPIVNIVLGVDLR